MAASRSERRSIVEALIDQACEARAAWRHEQTVPYQAVLPAQEFLKLTEDDFEKLREHGVFVRARVRGTDGGL